MENESGIRGKVSCSDCKNLVGNDKCALQVKGTPRQLYRLWFECGSKHPKNDSRDKRFCQHWWLKNDNR
jgi:hypothetical protein